MGPVGGSSYIIGKQHRAVLRPVRTVLHDREQVWGGITKAHFFVDCRTTADGRLKDNTFTNVWQSGCLGTPLEFILSAVSIRPVFSDPEYVEAYERFIWSDYVLTWIMGAQTIINEQPLTTLRVKGPTDDVLLDKVTGKPYRIVVSGGKIEAVPEKDYEGTAMLAPAGLGGRLLTRWMDMRGHDNKGCHITSTESFMGKITRSDGVSVHGKPIDVYLCMDGLLLKQI